MGTGKIPDVNDYKWELLRHHERLLSKQALTSWDLNDNAAVALRSRNRRSPNLCRATSTLTASLTRPVKLAGTLVSASPQALLVQGNADRDRDVDNADFLIWQRNFRCGWLGSRTLSHCLACTGRLAGAFCARGDS